MTLYHQRNALAAADELALGARNFVPLTDLMAQVRLHRGAASAQ